MQTVLSAFCILSYLTLKIISIRKVLLFWLDRGGNSMKSLRNLFEITQLGSEGSRF